MAKSWHAWTIETPSGPWVETRRTRVHAIATFVNGFFRHYHSDEPELKTALGQQQKKDWDKLRSYGYRAVPVTITVKDAE